MHNFIEYFRFTLLIDIFAWFKFWTQVYIYITRHLKIVLFKSEMSKSLGPKLLFFLVAIALVDCILDRSYYQALGNNFYHSRNSRERNSIISSRCFQKTI